ncbi:MAG: hypothetical protein Q7U53_15295 [Anaerolineaceae bacterium]|nr:hypothetical protein [Anaerolineaceae bacterium]
MNRTKKDISAHIDSLPDEFRHTIKHLDKIISDIMVGHSRVLWEGPFWGGSEQAIIGYGDLTQTQSRGKIIEWFMVGLALQKNYISIYVNAVEDGQYVAEKYRSKLGKVKVGKASISFKNLNDLDIDTLQNVVSIARDQLTIKS